MKRPIVPGMDQLESILRDIRESEGMLQELRNRLQEMPQEIAQQLNNESEKVQAARYLYWVVQEIPTETIAKSFFGCNAAELRKRLGKISVDIECDRCRKSLEFSSRNQLKDAISAKRKWEQKGHRRYAEGYILLCEECEKELYSERNAEYRAREARWHARINELKSMPYSDYLQSAEWRERRLRHLKSVGYKCQVCNSSQQPIDVHHRTYERRGEENYKDLIALCRNCHELFHKQGRIME